MQRFTQLYTELDETNRTGDKVNALIRYFSTAPPEDAVWALYLLTGRRLARAISTTSLRAWAAAESGLPAWLVDECYDTVGDIAETLALLLPEPRTTLDLPLHQVVAERILPLAQLDEAGRHALVVQTWHEMDARQRFVWHKLITGAFRVGVGRTLVVRALAAVAGISQAEMAHRLMGHWQPTAEDYLQLIAPESSSADITRPYPFYLAYALETSLESLGPIEEWLVEWKWDGIRAQLIRRQDQILVWTRGEELVTEIYPELVAVGQALPNGVVIDGEILAWQNEAPLPFQVLQQRIGRKRVDARLLQIAPVVLVAYDLLEQDGQDIRSLPLTERRNRLAELISQLPPDLPIKLSLAVDAPSWDAVATSRDAARDLNAEGLMLKRRASTYGVGRVKGDWWKWKLAPYTIDAVLIYAQPGHGRRAGLYTDYTFAVWHNGELVPVAKAYSGLTDAEIRQVDAFVRRNTLERFGPVRSVKPELVFELAFEGIQPSNRHKSGIALRFPRMLRWRHDKKPQDADTLEMLQSLLTQGQTQVQTP